MQNQLQVTNALKPIWNDPLWNIFDSCDSLSVFCWVKNLGSYTEKGGFQWRTLQTQT